MTSTPDTGHRSGTVYVTGGRAAWAPPSSRPCQRPAGTPAVIDRAPPDDRPSRTPSPTWPTRPLPPRRSSELVDAVGPPDAVVTAAGTDACGPLGERRPRRTWERVVRVNLFGTASVVRAACRTSRRATGHAW